MVGNRAATPRRDTFSANRVIRLKRALGIPRGEGGVGTMVRSRERRLTTVMIVSLLVVLTIGALVTLSVVQKQFADEDKIAAQQETIQALRQQIDGTHNDFLTQRTRWEVDKVQLVRERQALERQLAQLEKGEEVSTRRICELRTAQNATTERLEQYNPIHLEREKENRRDRLQKVLDAVVYIEREVSYRDRKSNELLHIAEDPIGGFSPNLEKRGEALLHEGGGSGFCVSPDGWILTNAHVVEKPTMGQFSIGTWDLVAEMHLAAVFSGTATRHEVSVSLVVKDDGEDLALLRIEPFEGMPFVENFSPDVPPAKPGIAVRLFDFPLGKIVPQEGETLSASIFSGIAAASTRFCRFKRPFIPAIAAARSSMRSVTSSASSPLSSKPRTGRSPRTLGM